MPTITLPDTTEQSIELPIGDSRLLTYVQSTQVETVTLRYYATIEGTERLLDTVLINSEPEQADESPPLRNSTDIPRRWSLQGPANTVIDYEIANIGEPAS